MQINENEARDDQTRKSWTTTAGCRSVLRRDYCGDAEELQDVHDCISPYMLEQAAEAAGVRDSMVQAICRRYPSLKTAPYNHADHPLHRKELCVKGKSYCHG